MPELCVSAAAAHAQHRHGVDRALGQNFVVSQHVLDSIVASAQIAHGDAVVEVGPGLGGLTETLLSAGHAPALQVHMSSLGCTRDSLSAAYCYSRCYSSGH